MPSLSQMFLSVLFIICSLWIVVYLALRAVQ